MLRQAVNELTIELVLKTESPLFVRDGRFDRRMNVPISHASRTTAQTAFEQAETNVLAGLAALPFYIPGTSLRGPWRAHVERTLRSMYGPGPEHVCDPFEKEGTRPNQSCSYRLEGDTRPFAHSCPVCRLFGSTNHAARIAISDAEVPRNAARPRPERRDMVGISRATGGVSQGATFHFFVLQDAQFRTAIRVRNFELMQIRLISDLLNSIPAISIGGGKSKGFGRVSVVPASVRIAAHWFGTAPPGQTLAGIAEHPLWGREFRQQYALIETPRPPALPHPWSQENGSPWRWHVDLTPKEFATVSDGITFNPADIPALQQPTPAEA